MFQAFFVSTLFNVLLVRGQAVEREGEGEEKREGGRMMLGSTTQTKDEGSLREKGSLCSDGWQKEKKIWSEKKEQMLGGGRMKY